MLLVASCRRGPEPFATKATYDARASGVRVIVYAKGKVLPGHDLADDAPAVAIVCPTTKAGRPFRIDIPPANVMPRKLSITDAGKTTTGAWTTPYREGTLTNALDGAGYAMPDPAEIAELADTIDGVALGPKGTRIAGQTHRLMVASVEFEARAEPTTASCSP